MHIISQYIQHVSESFHSLVPVILSQDTFSIVHSTSQSSRLPTCKLKLSEMLIGEILAIPMTHVCQCKNQTPA